MGVSDSIGEGLIIALCPRAHRRLCAKLQLHNQLPVLKTNLYGMEGEPSVFDRELGGVCVGGGALSDLI